MIRCAVFDFDGVILDSNPVKDFAYDQALNSCFPGNAEIVRDILRRPKPMPRAQTMAQIVERLVANGSVEATRFDAAVTQLVDAYGRFVDAGLEVAPPMPGIPDILEPLALRMPLYVNTLNPRDRLVTILQQRNLARFFREVYGSERSKIDNLADIVDMNGPADSIVVIGDGILDWESARYHRTAFIAVNMPVERLAAYPAVAHVAGLGELPQIIAAL